MGLIPDLGHGITTRETSSSLDPERLPAARFNLGLGCGDEAHLVQRNRAALAAQLGFSGLLIPQQVHGDLIRAVDGWPMDAGAAPLCCDALTTDQSGVLLGVLGADCPGVLIVDPERHALAVVHAGWRGVVARIVPKAIAFLQQRYGAEARHLNVGIGPGISSGRYEVTTDVATQISAAVAQQDEAVVVKTGRPGHAHVDLIAAIRSQLTLAGVSATRVEAHGACTYEEEHRFFSHRREAAQSGRHALVAGWLT